MNADPQLVAEAKPRVVGWSRQRWMVFVALAFVAHVTLIFIFGAKKSPPQHVATRVPQLQFAGGGNVLVALTDPTLFALPHVADFAPVNWLRPDEATEPAFHWTEPPPFLMIAGDSLGAIFHAFMQTNRFPATELNLKPEPQATMLFTRFELPLPQESTLHLSGQIAQRQLLKQIEVPTLPCNDVIRPSRVQVLVDENGNVVSDVLLESSDFSKADQAALELARRARFVPEPGLMFGTMTFYWHTVPTNAPVKTP